jgi:hypothetical protein
MLPQARGAINAPSGSIYHATGDRVAARAPRAVRRGDNKADRSNALDAVHERSTTPLQRIFSIGREPGSASPIAHILRPNLR